MQDFLLDTDGDLLIQNGDFAIGPSDMQHVEDIIQSFPGWWKQHPALGVGIMQFLKSDESQKALGIIKQQLKSDGYNVKNIKIGTEDGELRITFPDNGISR